MITVPEHVDRVSVTVVVGENTTTTVSEASCVIEATPADLDVTSFSINRSDTNGAVSVPRARVFKIYKDLGEISAEERRNLPKSTREACKGKPIHKTEIEIVTEETFLQMKNKTDIEENSSTTSTSVCANVKVLNSFIYESCEINSRRNVFTKELENGVSHTISIALPSPRFVSTAVKKLEQTFVNVPLL